MMIVRTRYEYIRQMMIRRLSGPYYIIIKRYHTCHLLSGTYGRTVL